ncbi:salivary glue protein Sgs-5-like [Anastrepha ludens]|uniref:salivary glue protein Sgs-5-like n=1 Tax=Anastrepha ludens TaxID=28586 RepID=UPI0023B11CE6|nr:salivary glue protein Sgs-5-like [Anastrepha ludens]
MCTYRRTPTLLLSLSCFALIVNSQQLQQSDAADKRVCEERCNLVFRCDPYYSGPPVWTIMDGICKLFKTDCLFANANCQRQNECKPRLVLTTQQMCQTKCRGECENVPNKPVCAGFPYVTMHGDRDDGMITFKNQCELDKWSCWNSKAYIYVNNGTCF